MNTMKRRTYSIHPDRADDLAIASIEMGKEIGKTVNRQVILDVLVHLLTTDGQTRKKVLSALKQQA